MSIESRRLPFDEWSKLAGTELAHLATLSAEPRGVVVVVVEQTSRGGETTILATWSRIIATHVEGLWFRELARGNPAVGRSLLREMMGLLRAEGVAEVLTSSDDPAVDQMIEAVGGKKVPGQTWTFPVPSVPSK